MRDEKQEIDDPVSQLLGSLKRVEAPGDFDFRVKARIAQGRPTDRNRSWLPASVRLAVPLGLLLAVGGYFGLDTIYSPDQIAVAPVVEMQPAPMVPINEVPPSEIVSPPASQNFIARSGENKPAVRDATTLARRNEKRIVAAEPSGSRGAGSREETRRISTTLRPKGLDGTTSASAHDILSFIGAVADGSLKVISLKPNSLAERSGLKAGDVIEAINGQNLTERSTFVNKFSGRTIRVRRDGQTVQISLKP